MLHGTSDIDVPYQLSIDLLDALICSDATLTLIKGGDHRLSSEAQLQQLGSTVTELMEKLSLIG